MLPYTVSARSLPTSPRTHSEKYSDTMPIENIVFARS